MYHLCVISLVIATATAFTRHKEELLRNVDLSNTDLSSIDEKWIDQPLDHFDANEKRTYKMRYFENLQFWKQDGPIYVFLGGEDEQEAVMISDSDFLFTPQLAKETQGALIATEHRYYGKSLPDLQKNNTIEYYKFLSAHQALEDIANLIKELKSDPKFKSSKVVVIGGSYSGNLAAWMRELHPELVDAAISSSAPVLAKKDFHEYLDTVRYTFGKYGTEDCLDKIEKDFKKTEELFKTKKGQDELKAKYNLCPETDLTVLENQEYFFSLYKYSELKIISQHRLIIHVQEWCKNEQAYDLNPHKRMSTINNCYLLDFKSIDWTKNDGAPWFYQFCTEFGYLQTTSSEKQPFVHWNPLNFFLKMCKGFVKGDPEERMDEGIAKTNKLYGGLTPNVTKVVFTHGDMDPWHTLGVLKDLGPDAPARIVNGSSHCGLLIVEGIEPKEMEELRKYVTVLIKKWIS